MNIRKVSFGYIKVHIEGSGTNRFINLCTKNHILLYHVIKLSDNEYSAELFLSDFMKMKPYAKKTKVKIRILKKDGIYFKIKTILKHRLFLLFFVCIVFLIFYSTKHIWKVEINGNSYLTEEEICLYLQKNDYYIGQKKKNINCDDLENQLRFYFPEIIWSSVHIEGSTLSIEVQEKIYQTHTEQEKIEDLCYDIIASEDAVISEIITRNGIPLVKKGQSVSKGELLVTGRQEIFNDDGSVKEYFYRSADADVVGLVTFEFQKTIPILQKKRIPTNKMYSTYHIKYKDNRYQLPTVKNKYENYNELKITNFSILTFQTEKTCYYEVEEILIELTKEEAKQVAVDEFNQYITELKESGLMIIDSTICMEKKGGSYYVNGTVSGYASIVTKHPTEILEQPKENEDNNESYGKNN